MSPEETLMLRMEAQHIKRYHTMEITGTQTVGEHTYGAVQILRYLVADKGSQYVMACIEAMLDHDVPEAETGDMPHTAKRNNHALSEAMALSERAIEMEYHLNIPVGEPMIVDCKCADLLEMAYFGLRQLKQGNLAGEQIISTIGEAIEAMKEGGLDIPPKASALFVTLANQAMDVTGEAQYVSE